MAPPALDRSRLEALLADAGVQLDGEWLLIGGAAAATWFADGRTTDDIDLIALDATRVRRMAVMDLAVAHGLPVEAVNSSADYFVRRIEGWRDELVPLVQGPRAVIYRPTPTLFLLLKLARLSAVDLDDCLALIEHCRRVVDPIDRARVAAALSALPATTDAALAARRAALAAAITP